MSGILAAVFEKDLQLRGVPHMFPHCEEAEVNIFMEVISPSLFSYAKKNIWIPTNTMKIVMFVWITLKLF
jgi:hypothetical protein